MTAFYEGREVWFYTGSQDLYGEDVLVQVADQSREVVRLLNESGLMPAPVVWKPVLKDSDSIRRAMLEAIRYVDLVVPENNWEQKVDDLVKYEIDTFVMGDDWTGRFDEQLGGLCEIVYLPRTPEISTTQIKSDMTQS